MPVNRYVSVYAVWRSLILPVPRTRQPYREPMAEATLVQPAAPHAAPVAPTRTRWSTRLLRLYWAAPALLMAVLGCWRIRRPALWADELATWGAVRLSWAQLWRLLGTVDATLAPYYLGLKVWTAVAGTGTAALRAPSVLAMSAAAGLVAVLAARLASNAQRAPVAGLIAGVIFALTPAASRYAQEARPYAFVILFATLATLALLRLLEAPGPGRAAGYALCVLLVGAAHLVAVLLVSAHAVAVLRTRRRRALIAWSVGCVAGLLALLPLALAGAGQRDQVTWIPRATWVALASTPETIFGAGAVGGALVLLATLAANRRPATVLLAAWALLPALALFVLAQVADLYWPRYLLFTLPAWVVLAARALTEGDRPAHRWRVVAVLGVIAVLAAPAQAAIRRPAGHLHATAAAGGIITANARPGDAFAVALDEAPEPWEARDIVARYVPADRRPTDVFATSPQRTDGRLLATECADLAGCLDRTDPARIWVIRFEAKPDPLRDIGPAKETLLRDRYTVEKVWLLRGLTVALLVRS